MCTVCTKCVHDTLYAHFCLEVYTWCTLFVEPKHFVQTFFWAAGNFLHTFPGQDRTSSTLFKAVFLNLCVLALHPVTVPVHTVRPPTWCPVPPGAPSARPTWIKLCGVCLFILASGPLARRTACCCRMHAGRGRAAKYIRPRGGDQPPVQARSDQVSNLISAYRERPTSPCPGLWLV